MGIRSLLLCALLAGCSTAQPPRIEIARLAETSRSDEAVRFEFEATIHNAGTMPLVLEEFEYEVVGAAGATYAGRRAAEMNLPAQCVRSVRLPVIIDIASVNLGSAGPWSISGRLTYLEPGRLAATMRDLRVYRPSAPLEASLTPSD